MILGRLRRLQILKADENQLCKLTETIGRSVIIFHIPVSTMWVQ